MATVSEKTYVLLLISNGPDNLKELFRERVEEVEKSLDGYLSPLDAMNSVLSSWVDEMRARNIPLS